MKDSQEGQLERGHLLYKGSPSTCVGSDIQDRQLPECEAMISCVDRLKAESGRESASIHD